MDLGQCTSDLVQGDKEFWEMTTIPPLLNFCYCDGA
jgi:hypothetical protein